MIGYNLEEIENLPDKVPQKDLDYFMQRLYQIGAIDPRTRKITDLGKDLGKFMNLSPILSASIIECTSNLPDPKLYSVLGAFITYIFNDSTLVQEQFSEQLQKNFCEDSDVMTVLKTILDIPINYGRQWKTGASKYGLNQKNTIQILYNIKQIGQNLGIITNENDDSIYQRIQDLIKRTNMNAFIQTLIETIGMKQKEWIDCRKANFKVIENCMFSPHIIYESEISIQRDDIRTQIQVNQRPGSFGFSCPAHAFILKIDHSTDEDTFYGNYIQKNISMDENDPHPVIIKSTPDVNNEFADALIVSILFNPLISFNL